MELFKRHIACPDQRFGLRLAGVVAFAEVDMNAGLVAVDGAAERLLLDAHIR